MKRLSNIEENITKIFKICTISLSCNSRCDLHACISTLIARKCTRVTGANDLSSRLVESTIMKRSDKIRCVFILFVMKLALTDKLSDYFHPAIDIVTYDKAWKKKSSVWKITGKSFI